MGAFTLGLRKFIESPGACIMGHDTHLNLHVDQYIRVSHTTGVLHTCVALWCVGLLGVLSVRTCTRNRENQGLLLDVFLFFQIISDTVILPAP